MQHAASPMSRPEPASVNLLEATLTTESDASLRNEGWMISFIDILTLLLTLFVLLLVYKDNSPEDGKAAQQAQASVQHVIQQEAPQTVTTQAGPASREQQAASPADSLLLSLKHSGLQQFVEVHQQAGIINLETSDSILFKPASAELTAEGITLLNQLALILAGLPYPISVEGHTDNTPIHSARFPSNWELSAARATRVTRKLIAQGINPAQIRSIGYGATQPRADNRSAQGRAKNRRVSFVLQLPAIESHHTLP